MTWVEIAMVVIAAAMVAIGLSVVILVRRVLPVVRNTNLLIQRTTATMTHLESVAGELEHVTHDARALERRVNGSLHEVLDQVEPTLRILNGVLAGLRSGLGAIFHRR